MPFFFNGLGSSKKRASTIKTSAMNQHNSQSQSNPQAESLQHPSQLRYQRPIERVEEQPTLPSDRHLSMPVRR